MEYAVIHNHLYISLSHTHRQRDRVTERVQGVVTALKPVRAEQVIEAARAKAELDCATLWVCFA